MQLRELFGTCTQKELIDLSYGSSRAFQPLSIGANTTSLIANSVLLQDKEMLSFLGFKCVASYKSSRAHSYRLVEHWFAEINGKQRPTINKKFKFLHAKFASEIFPKWSEDDWKKAFKKWKKEHPPQRTPDSLGNI
jgi:hypothetical protein